MSTQARVTDPHSVGEEAQVRHRVLAHSPIPFPLDRPEVRGKFLHIGSRKLLLRGVTYGPFRPDESGCEYHNESVVEHDFAAMAAAGINVVRTYTLPPGWLLDCARRHGLWVMVGISWAEHIAFLDQPGSRDEIEATVRRAVRACNWNPAVLCYVIGNEIPASIARWYGLRRIERFLRRLYNAVKDEDPRALVTYVNYPTTEYLRLPFLDFCCWNVYLERREPLEVYIARLQNLAGHRPLVLAELGMDSCRHGEDRQAEALDWQVRTAFEGGCAGVCVFSWTDEWFRGGQEIEGWGFGVTDRQHEPKPALRRLAKAFADTPFPRDTQWPRVSVVVCTYNGARTLRETCEALTRIDYPDFEVIVVCDGSTDDSLRILKDFGFRVFKVNNGGLSRARNIGLHEATGEIVAYLDDDAYPEPDWLKHLAWGFLRSSYAGVGGPNIPPPGDGVIAESVAHSPGGPNHVLVDDRIAEHIPGCNMAFSRSWLLKVGGFDPQFTIAGDDVDLCWRIQEQGGVLGFSPAAVVWHHRRGSVRAYLRQQRNYGRAEGMLAKKWPQKFNTAGHMRWGGRIYGLGLPTPFTIPRIYHGVWGTAAFQPLYEAPRSAWASLPHMPEWYLLGALAAVGAIAGVFVPVLRFSGLVLVGLLAFPVLQALFSARTAKLEPVSAGLSRGLWTRSLIALLHVLQPMWRLRGRLTGGLVPWRWPQHGFRLGRFVEEVHWDEKWISPEHRLSRIESVLCRLGAVARGGTFDRWDFKVAGGALGGAQLLMAVEEHGGGKQIVRIRRTADVRAAGVVLVLISFMLSILAATVGARVFAGALLVAVLVITFRVLAECSAAAEQLRIAVERARDPDAQPSAQAS